jgi:LacI family transcriptional regulator
MDGQKEITIYDIAKKLSISASTVSRALKDHPGINKKTKKKIFDAAERMGYRSNLFARNLREQKTMTIGVMVNDLKRNTVTSMLSGIEKVANEAGYGIIITDAGDDMKKETANAKNLFNRRVDGLIALLGADADSDDQLNQFIEKSIPVVLIDDTGHKGGATSVTIDNRLSAYTATRHLMDQGCKKIAFIAPGLKKGRQALRYRGYKEALLEKKLAFNEKLVILSGLSEEDAMGAAEKIMHLKPMPDGLVINDDFVAAVCIRTLQENGIRVPGQVAVVGFNNDTIGTLVRPALSSINYPAREIGESAARILINHFNGVAGIDQTSTVTIRSELIIRQSSLRKGS